jgi:hypothetical protein
MQPASEDIDSGGEARARRSTTDLGGSGGLDLSIERLYSELQSAGGGSGDGVRLAPEQRSEVILNEVVDVLFDGREFRFDESIVKENLEVVVLLLVANRSSGTHGKGLMGDLATIFDAHLSPGTVYPQLHDLEEDGLLEVRELVRTKEYCVEDEEALAERVTAAMEQHLALGLFLRAALDDLEVN